VQGLDARGIVTAIGTKQRPKVSKSLRIRH
jgi:hypothetical protein